MLRIGIVGSESSHAMQFAKYFNLPDPATGGEDLHPGIRVTAIMGDPESAGRTAELARVSHIAGSLEELVDTVDAVMITSRRGSQHMVHAIPFIEKGMPLFVDKPFTSSPQEAAAMAKAIDAAGCPVLGGSGYKYCESILEIKKEVTLLTEENKLLTAMLHFPIMLDSPYDGFWFYGSHLVEMCMEIFGTDIQAVQAMRTEKALTAKIRYPDFVVSLHFVTEVWKHSCTLITDDGPIVIPFDTAGSLAEEANRFACMLQGTYPSMTTAELVRPNAVIDTILRAESSGRTITFLSEII